MNYQDDIGAKIEAVNAANAYANQLAPVLIDYFRGFVGSKILKQDGTLLKKLTLPTFPADPRTPHIQVTTYRLSSNYSLGWVVKTCRNGIPPARPGYSDGCTYYETTVYVGELTGDVLAEVHEWKPLRTDYTLADIQNLIRRYERIRDLAEKAKGMIPHPFGDFTR